MGAAWQRLKDRVVWVPPTKPEIASVAKAALAAAVAWVVAVAATDVPAPVLAPATAIITSRVSIHASARTAIERSAAVVLGVLAAVAVGKAVGLTGWSVAVLTFGALAVAQLLLRLPRQAATQVPVSLLLVMAAVAAGEEGYAWERALDTVIGAAVGVAVVLLLPASRVADARRTLRQLATTVADLLETMGVALHGQWSTQETAEWRRTARVTRQRLVEETSEAVGGGSRAAVWNLRDRPRMELLRLYEDALPRFERAAIGVWTIARGLDAHAVLTGGEHRPMAAMGDLLGALAGLVRAYADEVVDGGDRAATRAVVDDVVRARAPCAQAAHRQTHAAPADLPVGAALLTVEWMSYTALLVQVDRILEDLRPSE